MSAAGACGFIPAAAKSNPLISAFGAETVLVVVLGARGALLDFADVEVDEPNVKRDEEDDDDDALDVDGVPVLKVYLGSAEIGSSWAFFRASR